MNTVDIAKETLRLLTDCEEIRGPTIAPLRDVFAVEGVICFCEDPGATMMRFMDVELLELLDEIVIENQNRTPSGSLWEAFDNIHRICQREIAKETT